MARTHSLQKEKRMDPWRESGWRRKEASSMEMGSEPKQRRVGAKPVSETKQLQYLCLNSTVMTRYVRPFCNFEAFWGLARIQLGEFGFVLNRFEALVHQKQSCVVHIWTIWKSLIPEQDRKQGFPLPKTERTQALATFPVGTECLLCPIQVCKTAVISIVL